MAFRERNVVGTVVDADGAPVTSAQVSFKPTKPLGYTSTHIVVDRQFTAQTDTEGDFIATLWVDGDSLTPIDYTVNFPIANGGNADSSHSATISLVYEDGSAKNIGTLIAETAEDVPAEPDTLGNIFDAAFADSILGDLFDVVLTAPADGHVLEYATATGKWINAAPSGGGGMSIGGAISGGASNGSLLFVGSGNLAQDNANIFFDDTNNRLGIGINSSLAAKLHILIGSAAEVGALIKMAAGQTADPFQVQPNGSTTPKVRIDNNGNTYIDGRIFLSGGGNYIAHGDSSFGDVLGTGDAVIGYNSAKAVKFRDNAGVVTHTFDKPATTGQVGLMLWDADNSTMERVTVGAADSGGSGFKVLRIAN